MSTQQDPTREASLAFILRIEAMDRHLREIIEGLKDVLLIRVNGTSEHGPNRATRRLPATPGPNPPAALVPFLTGDTLLARLLVALLSLSASMTEAEQIFGYFRHAIASVEEEAARLRQRQEPEDNGREADME